MGLAFQKFDYASLLADVLLWLRLFPYSNVGIVIGWLSSTSFSWLSTVTKNKWRARGRIRKWISSPWKADEELHYIFLLYRGIALKSRGKFDFRELWNYWEEDLIYYQIYYRQRYLIIRIMLLIISSNWQLMANDFKNGSNGELLISYNSFHGIWYWFNDTDLYNQILEFDTNVSDTMKSSINRYLLR